MPGENLTRIEAQNRANLIDVASYEIHLDLTSGDKTFDSITKVNFTAKQVGASTFIDAITQSVLELC